MRLKELFLATLVAAVPQLAGGTELSVSYFADLREFKRNVSAGDPLTFQLYTDPLCTTSPVLTQIVTAGSSALIVERVRTERVRGQQTRPARGIRLRSVLTLPALDRTFYLRVTGAGVLALVGECQLQVTVLDGPQGDPGSPGPTGPTGPPGPDVVDSVVQLESQLAALLQVVQIDQPPGAVTLRSAGDLVLEAGVGGTIELMDDALLMGQATVMGQSALEGDVMMMQNATVMGQAELEGNVMMMQNATVMGQSALEGDVMMMQNATVMGQAELEGDVMMMQNATVMGQSALEGDVMMMQNATVMGQAELEGDVMMMQDATVMGEADLVSVTNIAGTLILPDQDGVIGPDGVLTPASSTVTISAASNALTHITPATKNGTILELRFEISAAGATSGVISCEAAGSCDGGGATPGPNIVLKDEAFDFIYEAGDTLKLVSDDTFSGWREISRSGAQIQVFEIVDSLSLNPGQQGVLQLNCEQAPDGVAGAILLVGSANAVINSGPGTGDEVDILLSDQIVAAPNPAGGDLQRYRLNADNTSSFSVDVLAVLRCLSI